MNINELIIKCKQGNRQAEKELFFRFAGKVLTICRRYASSDQEAKDYMQESFLQVFEKIQMYEESKGVFDGWLHQVCTNKILELIRKSKRGIHIVYLEVLPEVKEENNSVLLDLITTEDLIACIQTLPNGYQEVLNLYVFEGLRHSEIAKHLNISVSTSRSQYTRAKALLKQRIQKKTGLKYERC